MQPLRKNLTPFFNGFRITSRNPPEPEMVLVLRGVYAISPGEPLAPITDELEQGFLTDATYHEDDVERVGEAFYPGDFAEWKPTAEVIVRGTCHAPGGQPVPRTHVRAALHSAAAEDPEGQAPELLWEKTLMVSGDRIWKPGLIGSHATDPQPFTQMPLDWTRAYGGEGFADNPVGLGADKKQLPNVEDPKHPVQGAGDHPRPANLGPVAPAWPLRHGKIGRNYGKKWKRERSPWVSDDFDWTHHMASLPDQHLPGYLVGDETLTLQNLHSQAELLQVALPAQRIRAFAKNDEGTITEVEMVLDTLYADMNESRLYLTWRGLTPVREPDMTDVTHVLFAAEEQADEPLPAPHYEAILEEYAADPAGIKEHMPEGFEEAAKAIEEAEEAGKSPADLLQESASGEGNPLSNFVRSRLGGVAAEHQATMEAVLNDAAATWQQGAPGQVGSFNEQLMKGLAGAQAGAPPLPAVPMAPGMTPQMALGPLMKHIADARDRLVAGGYDGPELAKIDELLNNPKLKQIDPGFKPPEPQPPDAGGVKFWPPPKDEDDAKARAEAIKEPAPPEEPEKEDETGKPGRDLSHEDFSGQDLTHEDFTDCILDGANFTGANVTGVKFCNAHMHYTNCHKVQGEGADFSGADASYASFGKAKLANASFSNAMLEYSVLMKAKLPGANLSGVTTKQTLLVEADLTGAAATGGTHWMTQFDGATVEGADFSGSSLIKCSFRTVKGRGVKLVECDLTEFVAGMKAELQEAVITGATGPMSIWENSNLSEADFGYATLTMAFFQDATCVKTSFYCADLTGACFRRASLQYAGFQHANLLKTQFPRAQCLETQFGHANIYDTVFYDAVLADCEFGGTSLKYAITRES